MPPRRTRQRRKPAPKHRRASAEIIVVIDGIRRLERGLRLAAREVERATGISAAQLFVLEQLVSESPASVSELARRTLTDRSSVSVVVDRLVASGYAGRRPSRADRRRLEISITPKGRRLLDGAPIPPTDLLIAALQRLQRAHVARLGTELARLTAELQFEEARLLFEDGA